jgi:hypothetical protein
MNAHRMVAAGLAVILVVACLVVQRDSANAVGGTLLYGLYNPSLTVPVGFGSSVAVGDVNGDGKTDVAVGAPWEHVGTPTSGRAFVFSGAGGAALLYTLDTPNPREAGSFGSSLAVGDLNGDGKADIAVGAPGEGVAVDEGRTYVFSGDGGTLLYTLLMPNPQPYASFGSALAVGDVNGDGKADIAVGAFDEDVGANINQGRVYVFSGADGALLYTLDTPNPQATANFGTSLAFADLNGDGAADILVGAPGETVAGLDRQGRAYVFSGADGTLIRTLAAPPGTGGDLGKSVALGDTNGDGTPDPIVGSLGGNGQTLIYSGLDGSLLRDLHEPKPDAGTDFGASLAVADVNGDGYADVIAGADERAVGGYSAQGAAYAFSGMDGSLLIAKTALPSYLNPLLQDGYVRFGFAVAGGAVDASGKADIVVGSPFEAVESFDNAGAVYVFAGGNAVDTDGDGCPDPWESLQVPPTATHDPWDFYSVPVPALFAAPDPTTVLKDDVVSAGDAEAVFAYFKKGARTGTTEYEQDLNLNGTRDGLEYDRRVIGPGQSGPPDGVVAAADAQLAFAQFKLGYKCKF